MAVRANFQCDIRGVVLPYLLHGASDYCIFKLSDYRREHKSVVSHVFPIELIVQYESYVKGHLISFRVY